MVPTKNVVEFFINYISSQAKEKLDYLFLVNQFNICTYTTILTIPYDLLVYEQPDTNVCSLTTIENDEYLVYRSSDILSHKHAKNVSIHHYQLVLVITENNKTYNMDYDPNKTIPSILESFKVNNLPENILQEYIFTCHHFSNMIFHNHSNSRMLYDIPKLTLAINGIIFNRPNIEYYVVFGENYETYTVQVYTLLPTGRRDEMLFGVWINAKTKYVFDPYIIKLIAKKL